jgi:DNA-binding GntR family transcriptional regulator
MGWIARAQRWLEENAARLFQAWLQTHSGKAWQRGGQYRRDRALFTQKVTNSSPYNYGFSLPDYHHDLIEAIGQADEETAKSIMLYHGAGACSVAD